MWDGVEEGQRASETQGDGGGKGAQYAPESLGLQ